MPRSISEYVKRVQPVTINLLTDLEAAKERVTSVDLYGKINSSGALMSESFITARLHALYKAGLVERIKVLNPRQETLHRRGRPNQVWGYQLTARGCRVLGLVRSRQPGTANAVAVKAKMHKSNGENGAGAVTPLITLQFGQKQSATLTVPELRELKQQLDQLNGLLR